jgi:putative CocE/NonD family hydrolase
VTRLGPLLRAVSAAALGVAALGVRAQDLTPATDPVPTYDVPVEMRDGVVLRADVWLPPPGKGRFPTLVYRTPYDRKQSEADPILRKALAKGYAVVLQDVRGRYGSEGNYVPYRREGEDGYDTIEWAAAQPWSNGAIGTWGLSYPGAVQWLAAVEAPPHLKAMVPAMTFSSPRNFFYAGGAWDLSWLPWIWNNIAPDSRAHLNLTGPRNGAEARDAWKTLRGILPYRLPLSDVPELAEVAPYYLDWLKHRPTDDWWDWAELRGRYGAVKAAVLNFSGWHDEAYGPEGAITNFLGLMAARRNEADPRTRLIIGPWTHGGEDSPRSGDRSFGPTAPIDYPEMVLRFMDRYVRGVGNGAERDPRVQAFVMGENVWRDGDTLPLPGTRAVSLYLLPGGRLGEKAPGGDAPSSSAFVSDPAIPVVDPYGATEGARDYRVLTGRKDALVFETEPLQQPLRVVGAVETEIHLSADAPDADLWVKLQDVTPEGPAWNLSSPGTDVLRVSEREGKGPARPLRGEEVVAMRLPNLRTGNYFGRGHRVRIVLMGSFMPHFSRNLQTGDSETESKVTRKATIRIHHDAAHASRIVLPVVPDEAPSRKP